MYDEFDDDRSTSTRFHIVRCALDDIRERLDDLPPSLRRDELAVEALSCAEAATRLECQLGSSIEARESLVRRIVDLEISVLDLGRQPVVGSTTETQPPHFAARKKRSPTRERRRHDDAYPKVRDAARAS